MPNQFNGNPEPVPAASQLAVIPFLAAVDGFLRETHDVPRLRITMHRAVNREDQLYLQQVCGYVRREGLEWRGKVGRTFKVTEGIMGAAFKTRRVWRTKRFPTIEELRASLAADIEATKDDKDPATVRSLFWQCRF